MWWSVEDVGTEWEVYTNMVAEAYTWRGFKQLYNKS